jgi:hypothetical protein
MLISHRAPWILLLMLCFTPAAPRFCLWCSWPRCALRDSLGSAAFSRSASGGLRMRHRGARPSQGTRWPGPRQKIFTAAAAAERAGAALGAWPGPRCAAAARAQHARLGLARRPESARGLTRGALPGRTNHSMQSEGGEYRDSHIRAARGQVTVRIRPTHLVITNRWSNTMETRSLRTLQSSRGCIDRRSKSRPGTCNVKCVLRNKCTGSEEVDCPAGAKVMARLYAVACPDLGRHLVLRRRIGLRVVPSQQLRHAHGHLWRQGGRRWSIGASCSADGRGARRASSGRPTFPVQTSGIQSGGVGWCAVARWQLCGACSLCGGCCIASGGAALSWHVCALVVYGSKGPDVYLRGGQHRSSSMAGHLHSCSPCVTAAAALGAALSGGWGRGAAQASAGC